MTDTYVFHCRWSEEDKAYVGTFKGMPSLSWLSLTKRNALRGIVGLVIVAEEDMTDDAEVVSELCGDNHQHGEKNGRQ